MKLVLALLLALMTCSAHADPLKKIVEFPNHTINLGDGWKATVSLKTAFTLDSIMGEAKISCAATWRFLYANSTEQGFFLIESRDLPKSVLNKLTLYNVDILYDASLTEGLWNRSEGYVACDPGDFYKSGSKKASFSIPASTNWARTINTDRKNRDAYFLKEDAAKKHLKALRKKGTLNGINDRILNASIDLNALKQFLKKKPKKKKLKKKKLQNTKEDEFDKQLAAVEDARKTDSVKKKKTEDDDFEKQLATVEDEGRASNAGDMLEEKSTKGGMVSLDDMLDDAESVIEQRKKKRKEDERRRIVAAKQRATRVCKDGLCGFQDKKSGIWALDYQFQWASNEFVDGLALVAKDGYVYFINYLGKPLSTKLRWDKNASYRSIKRNNDLVIEMSKRVGGRSGSSCGSYSEIWEIVVYDKRAVVISKNKKENWYKMLCLKSKSY